MGLRISNSRFAVFLLTASLSQFTLFCAAQNAPAVPAQSDTPVPAQSDTPVPAQSTTPVPAQSAPPVPPQNAAPAPAQSVPASSELKQSPELKQNPMALLKAFEAPADQPYQLGRGDDLMIEVIGRPELTGKHTVGPDGKITMPVAGPIMVADKTREEAAAEIQTALNNYFSGATVSVGVEHYTSNHVLLLGAVAHPGLVTFDKPPTLLEVISRGGVPPNQNDAVYGVPVASSAMSVPDECMIYRGNDVMVTVQLRSLLEEGNALANMRLKRDDIVFVPGANKYVSIMGMVMHPGTQRLTKESTLSQLLAAAGGPAEKAGNNPSIQIIHRGTDKAPGKTQVIAYKDVLNPKPLDLTLQSGDIIFVPESGFNKAAYTFEKLSPLVNLFAISTWIR